MNNCCNHCCDNRKNFNSGTNTIIRYIPVPRGLISPIGPQGVQREKGPVGIWQ